MRAHHRKHGPRGRTAERGGGWLHQDGQWRLTEGLDESLAVIAEAERKEIAAHGRGFDGVMGFSCASQPLWF